MSRPRLPLDDAQLGRLVALLADAAGLHFDASRRESLAVVVAERLRALGVPGTDAYLDLVSDARHVDERQTLVDAVTIHETHFFRNPPQVRALRRYVLPELLRAARDRGDRRVRIWSAGCSTGEEAYTLAVLLRELLPAGRPGWDVRVVGTDVSAGALEAARTGVYGQRSLQLADPADLARWFTEERVGGEPRYTVRDEVRELVDLRLHNLVHDPAPFGPGEADLVLCRNVTIYFARHTTRALMTRLHAVLRDGGYLLLGHAETLWQVNDDFRLVALGDAFVYRRLDEGAPGPAAERRAVLPERRTEQEPVLRDRRHATEPRRARGLAGMLRRSQPPTLDAVRVALAAGSYVLAADLAARSAAAEPLSATAHYLRGLALTNAGDDDGALGSLRRAVYLDPGYGPAQFLLAGALARTGQRAPAAAAYLAAGRALARTPPERLSDELEGRSAAELVALCDRLARDLQDVRP